MKIIKIIGLILILISINTASAARLLDNYDYQKTITLTGNTSGAQTDYQLLLNVTYDSDMQIDFDDLRFANDTHQIDAWLESKVDSSYALVWVEFPTTPADGIDQDYYMYYGNASVVNNWNITNTFLLGDDFSGASLDTDKWSIKDGSCSVSGGYAQPYGLPVFVITKTFTASNAVVHVKHIQTSVQGVGMVFRSTDEVRAVANLYITYLRNDNTLSFRKIVNDAPTVFNSTAYTQGAATYKQHITFNGTTLNVDIWKNATSDSLNATGDGTRTDGRIGFLNYVNVAEGAFKVDYIFARKYAINFPTYTFEEETKYIKNFNNLFESENSWDMLSSIFGVYESVCGATLFWLIIILIPFIMTWIKTQSVIIPSVLALITGSTLFILLPVVAIGTIKILMIIGIAGLLYHIIKSR